MKFLGGLFGPSKKQIRAEAVREFKANYLSNLKARYDAAQTSPDLERYWANTDMRSPTASMDRAVRAKMRSRARYEVHESNSFARGMLEAKKNDVIGPEGPSLQVTEEKEFNAIVEGHWNDWWQAAGMACKVQTLFAAYMADGEGFGERVFNPDMPFDVVGLDIALSEADLWQNPQWEQAEGEADGIFYSGRNVREYWRLKQHPGDANQWQSQMEYDVLSPDNVIHLYRCDRPGQKRGITHFASALPLFAELRRTRLAVITAYQTAAEHAGFIETQAGAFEDDLTLLDDFLKMPTERGMITALPAGNTFKQLKAEQPTSEFGPFSEHILAEIGRVLQMPLNIVLGSSRDYNFASGRLDYLLYWRACDVERARFSRVVMEKIFGWWLEEAFRVHDDMRNSEVRKRIKHRWVYPPRQPIDEVKSAQADKIHWEMGYLTDEQWAQRENVDVDAFYEQQERMVERRKEVGMPYPGSEDDLAEKQKTLVRSETFRNEMKDELGLNDEAKTEETNATPA